MSRWSGLLLSRRIRRIRRKRRNRRRRHIHRQRRLCRCVRRMERRCECPIIIPAGTAPGAWVSVIVGKRRKRRMRRMRRMRPLTLTTTYLRTGVPDTWSRTYDVTGDCLGMMMKLFEQAWWCQNCDATYRISDLRAMRDGSNKVIGRVMRCPGRYCRGQALFLRLGTWMLK